MGAAAVEQSVLRAQPAAHRPLRTTILNRLREVRYMPESVLHARRRAAAESQLNDVKPRNVLFVCHGNICRSPFAAAIFARLAPRALSQSVRVASVGFVGPGRTPPSKALTAGAKYGVDISAHYSALATRESLAAADLVVVMSEEQARSVRIRMVDDSTRVLVLGDLDPNPIERRTILDPWGGPDAAFDASYDRIDRCVRELVRILSA